MTKQRRIWVSVGCAVVALLASGAAAALPAQTESAALTWQSGEPTGVLLLARGWPQELVITAPCGGEPGVIDTGELRLEVSSSTATLLVGPSNAPHTTMTLSPQGPAQNCRIQASFTAGDANLGSLQLKSGFDVQQADLDRSQFPVVTRLLATGTAANTDYEVQITTRPSGSTPSAAQQALRLVAALALLAFVMVAILNWVSDRSPTYKTTRVSGWDLSVATVALASSVFTPALLDDGWMRQIARQFQSSGVFSNIYDNNDAWFPQGYWLQWLLNPLVASDLPLIVIRLAVAVMVVATWLIVRRAVLPGAGLVGRIPTAGAALVFLAAMPAWLLTLRPEPQIALLSAGVLAAGLAFRNKASMPTLALAFGLAAAAVAGHQTGWVVATPLILFLPAIIRWLRSSPANAVPGVLAAVGSGAATGLLLLFLDSDRWLWLEGVRDFSIGGRGQGEYHAFGLIRELDRWANLLSDTGHAGSGARLFAVALAAIVAALALAAVGAYRRPQLRFAVALALASWAGLVLTSSKWIWHLGALVPATALLGAAGWLWLTESGRRAPTRLSRSLAIGLLTLVAGVTMAFPRAWGVGDLATLDWDAFAETLGASGSRILVWLVVAGLAAVLAYLADGQRCRTTGLGVLAAVLVLLPSVGAWSWLTVDATRSPGWSFLQQNVTALASGSGCGAADDATVIVGASALNLVSPGPTLPVSAATPLPDADPTAPPSPPVAPFVGLASWGTWPADAPAATGSATGSFSSPWQSVTPGTTVTVWVRSPRASAMEATVRFADGNGGEFATTPIGLPIGEYADAGDFWRLTTVVVPDAAILGRVQVDDFSTRPDGWASFTSLAETQTQALSAVQQATIFTSPFLALAFPCVPPTPVSNGVLAKVDYLIQPPAWQVRSLAGDAIGTQVSCRVGADWCAYRMDYPQAALDARPLSSETP